MSIEIGIALEPEHLDGGIASATDLVALAEDRGLGLVVLVPTPSSMVTDTVTMAAWLAGATTRIAIGFSAAEEPLSTRSTEADVAYPSMVEKARETLSILAAGRIVTDTSTWMLVSRDLSDDELAALSPSNTAIVVKVSTADDVERLAAFAARQPSPQRSAAVRARRALGIDYDAIPASIGDTAVEPGDPGYGAVASTYLRGGAPGLVLRPRTPDDVADAVGFARRHRDVPLGVRSAGHGISGRSTNTGGVIIDVGAMNSIEVLDRDRRLVRIGPGATWKQVAETLSPLGLALGSGDYGGVGVGGLATAGGIGLLSRKHGLTIDHVRAVELVLADGSQVRTTRDNHPDLFWAVRGAGANFGIATSFEFEADEVGNVGWAQLVLMSTDIERSILRFGELASAAPRDTTVFFVTGPPRQGMSSVQLFAVVDSPDPDVVRERLAPFLELGALTRQQVVMTPYSGVMGNAADVGPDGQHGFGEPHSRSAFLPELTPAFARNAAEMLGTGAVYFFELRAMGGAIADVATDESAFSYRGPAFQLAAMGSTEEKLSAVWEPLREHFDGLYLSFETGRGPDRLRDAFPTPVLARLRELKRIYDPSNLFRDNFAIDPQFSHPTPEETTA